ncbi:MAG: DUF2589 domain-containing protein [Candidatus Magnetomorum sp.]|nr:DUF2589 domain-containing protein [Candidatus Magnetomorum sp.]
MAKKELEKTGQPLLKLNLTDITRGLHHAASTTYAMIAQQYLLMLDQFFDRSEKADEDGHAMYKAKMVSIDMGNNYKVNIPLVSLVAPKGLALDEMKVELSVRASESDVKKATHELDNSNAERASFTVNLSPKQKNGNNEGRSPEIIDITLTFKASDPPEALMRVIDMYSNLIQPQKVDQDPNLMSDN